MKTLAAVQSETFGHVYTTAQFLEDVAEGYISPYDGFGYFHDGEKELTYYTVWDFDFENPSDFEQIKSCPYVIWYNK